MSNVPRLEASGVTKRFGTQLALDRVSLAVQPGECLALVGESGSGKTTLLRSFNALVMPDEGSVRVDGVETSALDAVDLRRRIGYVPQDGGLLPHWSVLRNAGLVPWLRGMPNEDDLARSALARAGLEPERFGARKPRELSGGQRQRVAIARALAANPDVVLLDEPFGALDAITRGELQMAFAELRRSLGLTAVLVTHDLREAVRLADRIAVLRAGRIEQVSPARELVKNPATPYVESLLRSAEVLA